MPEEFFTVFELNQFVKDVINAGFPQPLWVCGEIQGYNRQKNKTHIFFQLTEKDEATNDTKATIDLVIWGSKKREIFDTLRKSESGFELEDGIEVKFLCKVDFYPPHGRVRLTVEAIDPVYTLGKLAQEKQKLIAELTKKGVLDKNKVLELPLVPLRIGLITSHDSAAYNDFRSELTNSGVGFKIYLRNTLMQGKSAEKDICAALDELQKLKLDVLVITRGGGSAADLSCFDSKLIAEKIAVAKLPVLSGIGHEIDLSITDLAAHTYAKTPTAIAQFLAERVLDFQNDLDEKFDTLMDLVDAKIENEKRKLKDCAHVAQKGTLEFLKEHRETLIRYLEMLKFKPQALIKQEQARISGYKKMIDIAHPVNTMRRGFTITRKKDGTLVRNLTSVKAGDEIITELEKGKISSTVREE